MLGGQQTGSKRQIREPMSGRFAVAGADYAVI